MWSGSEVSCCALQIEEALGLRMHFTAVLNCKTLRELAMHTVHLLNTPDTTPIGAGTRLACDESKEDHPDLLLCMSIPHDAVPLKERCLSKLTADIRCLAKHFLREAFSFPRQDLQCGRDIGRHGPGYGARGHTGAAWQPAAERFSLWPHVKICSAGALLTDKAEAE